MPHLQAGSLKLPFRGRSPRSCRTSEQGARIAVTRAGSQAARMLIAYLHSGPMTDLQLEERLGLPAARISARRGNLIDRRLVTYHDDIMGPFGAESGRYGLTSYGRIVATALAQTL